GGCGRKARSTAAQRFTFRFRVQPGQRRGHMTTQKWILLAEDNALDADLAIRALSQTQEHYHVVVAHDGLEALDCLNHRGNFRTCASENPAVILLDLKMPRVDGLEVLRQVKTDDRWRKIPVVMFTSSRE